MVYNPDEGNKAMYNLSQSMTDRGSHLMKSLEFKLGGTRKNKRLRYSNAIKPKIRRKKYKTNRNKSNVSRLFVTYKRFKEKCYQ